MQLRAFRATQGSTLRRKRLSVQHAATLDAEEPVGGTRRSPANSATHERSAIRPRASRSRIRRRRACRSRRAGFSTQQQRQLPDKLKTCRHGGTARIVPNTTGCVPSSLLFSVPNAIPTRRAACGYDRQASGGRLSVLRSPAAVTRPLRIHVLRHRCESPPESPEPGSAGRRVP